MKQRKPHWFIIMPKSKIKQVWQAGSICLLIYTAIFVPFQIAFLSAPQFETPELFWIDQTVNILFGLDFFLNFIAAVDINGRVEHQLGKIFISYFRSWMLIDLIACFPFDLVQPLVMPQ